MFLNLAPDRVEIKLGLDELIGLASRHGFAGIDLPLQQVATMPDPDMVAGMMRAAGLRWGGFELPLDFRRDQAAYDQQFERLKKWVVIAERLRCDRCYSSAVPGHNELDYRANFHHHVNRLQPVVQLLASHGIRLGMEFIGPKTLRETFRYPFIHTINGMLELCEAIAPSSQPGMVGVLLDCYHWWTSGATEADLLELLSNEKIVNVHVNDGRAGRSRDEQLDLERTLPCETGLIDSAAFMRALRTLGYDGPVTAEPFDAELKGKPPDIIAARVAASIRKMIAFA